MKKLTKEYLDGLKIRYNEMPINECGRLCVSEFSYTEK
jgi:hypothetical protein